MNEGSYYWNADMLAFKTSIWLKSLGQFRTIIQQITGVAWDKNSTDNIFIYPSFAEFTAIPSKCVNCAVLEQCQCSRFTISMAPLDVGLNDLGVWDSVWNILQKGEASSAYLSEFQTADDLNTSEHAIGRLVSMGGLKN